MYIITVFKKTTVTDFQAKLSTINAGSLHVCICAFRSLAAVHCVQRHCFFPNNLHRGSLAAQSCSVLVFGNGLGVRVLC